MDLQHFAEQYNSVRRDVCGDYIITGKRIKTKPEDACHIYDGFSDGRLGAYFTFNSVRKWNNAQRTLAAVGLVPRQNGDMEGCVRFDPPESEAGRGYLQTGSCIRPRTTARQLEYLQNHGFQPRFQRGYSLQSRGKPASQHPYPYRSPFGVGMTSLSINVASRGQGGEMLLHNGWLHRWDADRLVPMCPSFPRPTSELLVPDPAPLLRWKQEQQVQKPTRPRQAASRNPTVKLGVYRDGNIRFSSAYPASDEEGSKDDDGFYRRHDFGTLRLVSSASCPSVTA